ncbi:MAG: beta strand repeat-containing protein, partial [Bacteroidia bacterium]
MNKFYTYVKSLVLSLLLIGSVAVQAQTYVRSTFNAPFVPITIGGGATASTASGDGVLQTGIPIGFTFNYYGVPYTTIAVSTDGFASFTATTNSLTNTNLYTTTAPNAVIAPWWDDLTTSEILYQTTGTPGSQIFTIQWTSLSYWTTSTRTIKYQVKLHEGTDVIELLYSDDPITGTINTSESASIGICNQTGGPGNYIDAVTGSSFVNNSMMNSLKWPKLNFRFTPGTPTPVSAGLINVGIGQTYNTLWEAVADLNHRGSTGTVVLNLTDALYDSSAAGGYNMFPVVISPTASSPANQLILNGNNATLAWYGSLSGNIGNAASTTALFNTSEPILGIVGADNMVITSVNLNGNFPASINRVDRAISIINFNATDGAQNNTITDVNIILDRTNTSSIGIQSNTVTAPSAASGTNSNNTIRNFNIEDAYAGINLTGNATNPDVNNQIINTVCTNYNQIGNPLTPNDIGNGTAATYGIQLSNQSGFTVANNQISNVTNSGGSADGINLVSFQGTASINNNIINGIRNAGATSTAVASGIRATHNTTGTHTLRIYNNSISNITSGYTGTVSASRVIRGINITGTGGSTAQAYEVYNNSISIDGSASPNISSVCYEIATTTGPIFRVANNNFANFTAAQTGVARHYIYRSTSATSFGNTGSFSNNNNVFILNDVGTTGFIGQGNTTDYATLTDWQTAMLQDGASISVNPNFVNNTSDLHATNLALNGAGQTPPPYLTQDLDCALRTPDDDIGAYIINTCTGTPTAGTITGVNAVCSGSGTTLTLTGASNDAGITYQWGVSSTSGGPYTNLGTSGTQATGPLTTDAYYIVTVTCVPSGLSATTAEKLVAVNPLPNVTVNPTTANYCTGAPAIALTAVGAN